MIRSLEAVTLSTSRDSFKKIVEFYRDTLGLKLDSEAEMGEEDQFAGFKIGEANLYVMSHAETHGESHEPQRFMVNIEVDDIEKEEKRLKDSSVKQIEPVYHIEGYGHLSTFADPDGNYFQIVQVRAND